MHEISTAKKQVGGIFEHFFFDGETVVVGGNSKIDKCVVDNDHIVNMLRKRYVQYCRPRTLYK